MIWVSSSRSVRSGATITGRSGRLRYSVATAASRESELLYSCTAMVCDFETSCAAAARACCVVESGGLGHISSEPRAQRCSVVRINPRVFGGTGDRDVGEPVVDEAPAGLGIDIGDHAICGKSLRAVGGDSIAVVKLPKLSGTEADRALFLPVHEYGESVRLHLVIVPMSRFEIPRSL